MWLSVGCCGQFLKGKKGAGCFSSDITSPGKVAEHSQCKGEVGGDVVHHHRAEVAHQGGEEGLPSRDRHPCRQSLE